VFVHIDARTLRRYPVLAIVIGVATAAVIGWLLTSGWGEAQALFAQNAPERLSVHEIVSLRGVHWVTLSDGEWHCDAAVTRPRRSTIERWVRGPVDATEVPITGIIEGEILVANIGGAVNCEVRAGSQLTGVVGSTQIFSSGCGTARRWRARGTRVAVLDVGASPQRALGMIVALVAVALGGLVFAGYYFMLMFRANEPRAVPGLSTEPIQPN
jgi:hypothetical protein